MRLYRTKDYRDFFKDVYLSYAQNSPYKLESNLKLAKDHLTSSFRKNSGLEKQDSQFKIASLMHRFEKQFAKIEQATNANSWRDIAYETADWFRALLPMVTPDTRAHLMIQIGRCFHNAALCQNPENVQQADQKLALAQYMTAYFLSKDLSFDEKLYCEMHIFHSLLSLPFNDNEIKNLCNAIENQTLKLVEFFPFYQPFKSTFSKALQKNFYTSFMQEHLHELTMLQKEKLQGNNNLTLDFTKTDILYIAFEACLHKFYDPRHINEVEKTIRLNLMRSLLQDNNWTLELMQQNLTATYRQLNAGAQGFIHPTLPNNPNLLTANTAIRGFKLDIEKGQFTLFGKKENQARSLQILREIIINGL